MATVHCSNVREVKRPVRGADGKTIQSTVYLASVSGKDANGKDFSTTLTADASGVYEAGKDYTL
jgi:hypothetical protein